MKPRPRLRKTVKWGGAILCLSLLPAWAVSGWGSVLVRVPYSGANGWALHLGIGEGQIGWTDVLPDDKPLLYLVPQPRGPDFEWWFYFDGSPNSFAAPIWLLGAIALVTTAVAWRLDALARRRARAGHCPKCAYDRRGLDPASPCPECGAAPAAP